MNKNKEDNCNFEEFCDGVKRHFSNERVKMEDAHAIYQKSLAKIDMNETAELLIAKSRLYLESVRRLLTCSLDEEEIETCIKDREDALKFLNSFK